MSEPDYETVVRMANVLRVRLEAVEKERDYYRKALTSAHGKLKVVLEYVTTVDHLGAHLQKCPTCMELQPCSEAGAISDAVTKCRKAMRDILGQGTPGAGNPGKKEEKG